MKSVRFKLKKNEMSLEEFLNNENAYCANVNLAYDTSSEFEREYLLTKHEASNGTIIILGRRDSSVYCSIESEFILAYNKELNVCFHEGSYDLKSVNCPLINIYKEIEILNDIYSERIHSLLDEHFNDLLENDSELKELYERCISSKYQDVEAAYIKNNSIEKEFFKLPINQLDIEIDEFEKIFTSEELLEKLALNKFDMLISTKKNPQYGSSEYSCRQKIKEYTIYKVKEYQLEQINLNPSREYLLKKIIYNNIKEGGATLNVTTYDGTVVKVTNDLDNYRGYVENSFTPIKRQYNVDLSLDNISKITFGRKVLFDVDMIQKNKSN